MAFCGSSHWRTSLVKSAQSSWLASGSRAAFWSKGLCTEKVLAIQIRSMAWGPRSNDHFGSWRTCLTDKHRLLCQIGGRWKMFLHCHPGSSTTSSGRSGALSSRTSWASSTKASQDKSSATSNFNVRHWGEGEGCESLPWDVWTSTPSNYGGPVVAGQLALWHLRLQAAGLRNQWMLKQRTGGSEEGMWRRRLIVGMVAHARQPHMNQVPQGCQVQLHLEPFTSTWRTVSRTRWRCWMEQLLSNLFGLEMWQ